MARWSRIASRGNVEDRRGRGSRGSFPGGGRGAVGGIGGLGVVAVLLFLFLGGGGAGGGGGLEEVLGQLQNVQDPQPTGAQLEEFRGDDSYEVFASTVLGSNDDLWRAVFSANQLEYSEPKLVLFRDQTESACGGASSAVGPHYCPLDETIYLDETFFDELTHRFGAEGGDVAEAYVMAHEVAHHVQNELNVMDEVQQRQQNAGSSEETNQLSVGLELQADCFAGVWANSISDVGVFLPGEINEAVDAAAAVGDDRIQETIQGRVTPENWTHGSSQQRVDWFNAGFESGDPARCDTFG